MYFKALFMKLDSSLRTLLLLCIQALLVLGGVISTDSVGQETGFLDRTVMLEGTEHAYQVYVPRNYSSRQDWPVIVFLHGAGERGLGGLSSTQVGLGQAIRFSPTKWPAIVVFPQLPPGENWHPGTEPLAMIALDQTLEEFNSDEDRVYLTGLSMGGYGSIYLATRHPNRFAALAPVCPTIGGYRSYPRILATDPAVVADSTMASSVVAKAIADVPIWLHHGEEDPVFPVQISRDLNEALQAEGAEVYYSEYPETGHNSWDNAYASDDFIAWLFSKHRPEKYSPAR